MKPIHERYAYVVDCEECYDAGYKLASPPPIKFNEKKIRREGKKAFAKGLKKLEKAIPKRVIDLRVTAEAKARLAKYEDEERPKKLPPEEMKEIQGDVESAKATEVKINKAIIKATRAFEMESERKIKEAVLDDAVEQTDIFGPTVLFVRKPCTCCDRGKQYAEEWRAAG